MSINILQQFICNLGSDKSDIPLDLVDNSTFMRTTCKKYHTLYTYLFCVILRIIIGIIIYNSDYIKPTGVILLCAIIIIGFYSKCDSQNNTWKKYCRTVVIYACVLSINLSRMEPKNKKEISGLFIIIDAIFGLKSRNDVAKII